MSAGKDNVPVFVCGNDAKVEDVFFVPAYFEPDARHMWIPSQTQLNSLGETRTILLLEFIVCESVILILFPSLRQNVSETRRLRNREPILLTMIFPDSLQRHLHI